MAKKRNINTRFQLERQLEGIERRIYVLENQKAKFGDLYIPPHIQLDLEDAKKKASDLRRRITLYQKNNFFYRILVWFDTIANFINNFNSAFRSSGRKPKHIQRFRRNFLLYTYVVGFVSCLGIIMYILATRDTIASQTPPLDQGSQNTSEAQIPNSQTVLEGTENTALLVEQTKNLQPAVIVNTRGIGVLYRTEPRFDSPRENGPREGETVYLIESLTNSNGELWWKAQFPDGRIGYIPAIYIQVK